VDALKNFLDPAAAFDLNAVQAFTRRQDNWQYSIYRIKSVS